MNGINKNIDENVFNEDKYQLVCNKQNMILKGDKENNSYILDFEIKNPNFKLEELMNFQIYNLLEKLNKDIIEKIEIIKIISDNEIDILFVLKRIGASVGLIKKYMYIKTYRQSTKDLILLKSINIDETIYHDCIKDAEKIKCDHINLTILPFQDKLRFNYKFKIDINEDLPIYMENLIGIMMKKIFYRLKLFIENYEK